MERRRGTSAVLGAIVVALGFKGVHRGGGDADTLVQFSQNVVVDEIDLDVFVSPAFTSFDIRLAEQIEVSPVGLAGG